jgi:hypothetical protein
MDMGKEPGVQYGEWHWTPLGGRRLHRDAGNRPRRLTRPGCAAFQPGTRDRLADATTAVALAVVQRVTGDVMGLRLVAQGPAFSRLLGKLAA